MLPKIYRLPSAEIVSVARRGKRLSNPLFDVKVWYDDALPYPQFAISTSLKVSKKAVVRNRIRRKLRMAILELFKDTPDWAKKGRYLIVVKSEELVQLEQDKIKQLFSIIQ